MKKAFLCLPLALGLMLTGCAAPKQFEISLKEGLFQGTAEHDPGLTISVEFAEMDRGQYIKTKEDCVKDLSTIDTKFFTPYHVNLVFSEGNGNDLAAFTELVAKDARTTDTYKMKNPKSELGLSDVTLQLIDRDGDRTADELKIGYRLGGEADSATLAFLSAGTESPVPHHRFQYNCRVTADENIRFTVETEDTFMAATELIYYIDTPEGYKVVMYVDGEPYQEAEKGNGDLRFGYMTGYRDVDIAFRAVPIG